MRGTVRREGRALSTEEALRIINAAEYGVLATIDADGYPCTTALNHVLLDDGCLYFHGGIEGEKIDNIKTRPQVSFFVTGTADVVYEQFTMAYSSAVVNGTMLLLEDASEKATALQKIAARFSDGGIPQQTVDTFIESSLPHVAVFRLTPDHITGKARLTRRRACLDPYSPPEN